MSHQVDDLSALLDSARTPAPRREDRYAAWREELKGYSADMKSLRSQPPDEAMAWISSVSARALEMQLWTLDHDDRQATKFRVELVIPVKKECEFQFQVASRRQSVAQMDWEITRGYES